MKADFEIGEVVYIVDSAKHRIVKAIVDDIGKTSVAAIEIPDDLVFLNSEFIFHKERKSAIQELTAYYDMILNELREKIAHFETLKGNIRK